MEIFFLKCGITIFLKGVDTGTNLIKFYFREKKAKLSNISKPQSKPIAGDRDSLKSRINRLRNKDK
jgi:hypothetical protein